TYPAGGVFEDRLLREIVRQGILISARENLGLPTRDETFGEQFPESASGSPIHPLMVAIEFSQEGQWNASLRIVGASSATSLWSGSGDRGSEGWSSYRRLVTELSNSADAIAESLSAAAKKDESSVPSKLPPASEAEIEALLREMNFVSQYAAARTAHQAIRVEGKSLKWLGVLARSYAHLSALTHHTWSS
ncbi:unnamed protein product, partial [Ectocarpus sp. 4 AP-2014]